jgi:hypothetical protein
MKKWRTKWSLRNFFAFQFFSCLSAGGGRAAQKGSLPQQKHFSPEKMVFAHHFHRLLRTRFRRRLSIRVSVPISIIIDTPRTCYWDSQIWADIFGLGMRDALRTALKKVCFYAPRYGVYKSRNFSVRICSRRLGWRDCCLLTIAVYEIWALGSFIQMKNVILSVRLLQLLLQVVCSSHFAFIGLGRPRQTRFRFDSKVDGPEISISRTLRRCPTPDLHTYILRYSWKWDTAEVGNSAASSQTVLH